MLKSSAMLVLGIVITVIIAQYFGLSEIAMTLVHANWGYVFLAILIQIAILALLAFRLIVISKPQGYLSYRRAFKVAMYGTVMNLLTPFARIGGEPLKMYMLRKNFGSSKSSAIISIDTITEIIASFVTPLIIFIVFINFLPPALHIYFIVFFAIVIVFLVFAFKLFTDFSWLDRTVRWIVKKISKYRKVSDTDHAKIFHTTFMQLMKEKKILSGALGVTFAMKILEFARMWFVFLALGIQLPLGIVLILWAVLLILSMVPWLPGGLGLVEFGGISAFIMFGIEKGTAASGMLIDRFISFWFVLLLGGILFWHYKRINDEPNIDEMAKKSV